MTLKVVDAEQQEPKDRGFNESQSAIFTKTIAKKSNKKPSNATQSKQLFELEFESQALNPKWHQNSDFYFEAQLFEAGLLAFTTDKKLCKTAHLVTGGTFVEKKRRFIVCDIVSHDVAAEQVAITKIIVHDALAEKKDGLKYYKQAKKVYDLLAALTKGEGITSYNATKFIINGERSEEVFHPLAIGKNPHDDNIGIYLYAWVSCNKDFKKYLPFFSGFSQFVAATCMFGPSLRGLDSKNGSNMPLIKHDIILYAGQKIDTIEVDKTENSFYDLMVFSQLENIALIVKKFSRDQQPLLLLHLPYWDYVLFCLDIYIQGKMTLSALDSVIREIYLRKKIYIENINGICAEYQINVTIKSPFESLFKSFDIESLIEEQEKDNILMDNIRSNKRKPNIAENTDIAKAVLRILGLSTQEEFYSKFNPPVPKTINEFHEQIRLKEELEQTQKAFISSILEKLKDPDLNPGSHQIWQDFVLMQQVKFRKKNTSGDKPERIDNIEALLHIANACMPALGSFGKKPYETCSFLTISEKQIQATYADLIDNHSHVLTEITESDSDTKPMKSRYFPMVNFITVEPGFAYKAQNTSGLPFYCNTNCASKLADTIKTGLIAFVHQNIYHQIYRNSPSFKIADILPLANSVPTHSPSRSPQAKMKKLSNSNNKFFGEKSNNNIRKKLSFSQDETNIDNNFNSLDNAYDPSFEPSSNSNRL